MYNDTIKVANKIISDSDLMDIFQKMNEEMLESQKISNQEILQNEKFEREYQNWTMKNFEASFKCTFNFYDDTTITVDNYNTFMPIFNTRLQEVKDMWVRYDFSYWIEHGRDFSKSVRQYINMNIYENKMDIEVNLSSEDDKMDDVFQLIKEKITNAPEKYDRLIKKKNAITNKVTFALGIIPSIIICTLLVFVPAVRYAYSMTFVLFPIATLILGFMIGTTFFERKIDNLYANITPPKKYAGYDSKNMKSIYKDDIDEYLNTSEIIIGKNINNLENRNKITELEKKYGKFIPKELLVILVLSIIVVILGKLI